MSANDHPRLYSTRRAFLSSGAVAALVAGTTGTALAVTAEGTADPIWALIEAERVAWDAHGAAIDETDRRLGAFYKSEWHRPPRAQVGERTSYYVPGTLERIPDEERQSIPVFRNRQELLRDHMDARLRLVASGLSTEDIACRSAENDAFLVAMLAEVEQDAKAITEAREAFGLGKAEAHQREMIDAADTALTALCAATPTTVPGLLAIMDVWWSRSADLIEEPASTAIQGVLAAVRSVLEGRAA